jgi:hypothetical protein
VVRNLAQTGPEVTPIKAVAVVRRIFIPTRPSDPPAISRYTAGVDATATSHVIWRHTGLRRLSSLNSGAGLTCSSYATCACIEPALHPRHQADQPAFFQHLPWFVHTGSSALLQNMSVQEVRLIRRRRGELAAAAVDRLGSGHRDGPAPHDRPIARRAGLLLRLPLTLAARQMATCNVVVRPETASAKDHQWRSSSQARACSTCELVNPITGSTSTTRCRPKPGCLARQATASASSSNHTKGLCPTHAATWQAFQLPSDAPVCGLRRPGIGTCRSDGRPIRGAIQVFARFCQWLAHTSSAPAASASPVSIGPCAGFNNSR